MFRRRGSLFVAAIVVSGLVTVGGCYRKLSISMERRDSQYVLGFKIGGKDAGVDSLFVSTVQDGQSKDTVCAWFAQGPVNLVGGKWIYGGPLPPEYERHGCEPLVPGLYRIQAGGQGAAGVLNVRIDAAGNVQRL